LLNLTVAVLLLGLPPFFDERILTLNIGIFVHVFQKEGKEISNRTNLSDKIFPKISPVTL
jgi:hypothetical protein